MVQDVAVQPPGAPAPAFRAPHSLSTVEADVRYVLVWIQYDMGLCAYTSQLRIMARFHEEVFSDPDSPSGLNEVCFSLSCRTLAVLCSGIRAVAGADRQTTDSGSISAR